MKKYTWVIIGVVATGLVGGYLYLNNQIKKLKEFCIKMKGFKIVKATTSLVDITFMLIFTNKSKLEILLSSYDFDLILNGVKVGRLKNTTNQVIKPSDKSEINFSLSFNPRTFFDVDTALKFINDTMFDKSKIKIQVKGKFNGKLFNTFELVDYPIDINYTLSELLQPSNDTKEC